MAQSANATVAKQTRGTVGLVEVGDYLGSPAGDAARAVRRCGLRAAVDRQPGHPAEQIGRVVAQDPPHGQTLQRAGLVTLYVGARDPRGDGEGASVPETVQTADGQSAGAVDPGPAMLAEPDAFAEPAPDLARPDEPALEPQPSAAEPYPSDADVPPHTWGDEAPDPATRDLFGTPDAPRRRLYPREPLTLRLSGLPAWLRRRRMRILAGGLVLCWILFTLAHHHAPAAVTAVPAAPAVRPATRVQAHAPRRPARRAHAGTHSEHRRRRAHAVAPAKPRPRAAAAEPARQPRTEPPPAPAPTAREPEGEQTGGGPFSP